LNFTTFKFTLRILNSFYICSQKSLTTRNQVNLANQKGVPVGSCLSSNGSQGGQSFHGVPSSHDRNSRLGSEKSQEFRHAPVVKTSTQKTQSYKAHQIQVDNVDPCSIKSSTNKDGKNRSSIFNPQIMKK